MERGIISFLTIAAATILLTNCKKNDKPFDNYFFTDTETSSGPLYLFIDGENRGVLPILNTAVTATNDTVLNNALHLALPAGKYKIKGKDGQGTERYSGYLKFNSRSLSTGGTMGGQITSASGQTLVTKIFF